MVWLRVWTWVRLTWALVVVWGCLLGAALALASGCSFSARPRPWAAAGQVCHKTDKYGISICRMVSNGVEESKTGNTRKYSLLHWLLYAQLDYRLQSLFQACKSVRPALQLRGDAEIQTSLQGQKSRDSVKEVGLGKKRNKRKRGSGCRSGAAAAPL